MINKKLQQIAKEGCLHDLLSEVNNDYILSNINMIFLGDTLCEDYSRIVTMDYGRVAVSLINSLVDQFGILNSELKSEDREKVANVIDGAIWNLTDTTIGDLESISQRINLELKKLIIKISNIIFERVHAFEDIEISEPLHHGYSVRNVK